MKQIFIALLSLVHLFLLGAPSQARLKTIGGQVAGSVELKKDSTAAGDFMIATFSDGVVEDPVLAKYGISTFPDSTESPIKGCLSVARLNLHSGTPELLEPATLTFGCTKSPEGQEVLGWIQGEWQPIVSNVNEAGLIQAKIKHVTTYAIFPLKQKLPVPGQI